LERFEKIKADKAAELAEEEAKPIEEQDHNQIYILGEYGFVYEEQIALLRAEIEGA
jgi:hypothetical protein